MELREEIARAIYANVHHLMRETGTKAQSAYESAADRILAIPAIREAMEAKAREDAEQALPWNAGRR